MLVKVLSLPASLLSAPPLFFLVIALTFATYIIANPSVLSNNTIPLHM